MRLFGLIATQVHTQTIRMSLFNSWGCCSYERIRPLFSDSRRRQDSSIRPLRLLPQSTALANGWCMCNGARRTPASVAQLPHSLAPAQSFCHIRNVSQRHIEDIYLCPFLLVLVPAARHGTNKTIVHFCSFNITIIHQYIECCTVQSLFVTDAN